MSISCLITDDEPFARKGLRSYIEKIDFLQLVAECEDAISMNNQLQKTPVDLVFLDIEMPYINGTEILQTLANPPKVIFTTAYEKYALKGFDLEAIDYLLKPIPFDRFLKACNRAKDYFEGRGKNAQKEDFFVKSDGGYLRLRWEEILMIEGMENYICLHTPVRKHLVLMTLKQVLEQVPGQFIQIHKSTIINMDAITGISGKSIRLSHLEAAISRNLKEKTMEKILNNRLLKNESPTKPI